MKKTITLFALILSFCLYSQVDYDTQIQPIFDANCTSCHFATGSYSGGLGLNSYEEVMAGGYITAGGVVFSGVLQDHISSGYMPPDPTITLSEEETAIINQWIEEGANPSGNEDCCINPEWIDPMAMCPLIEDPVIGCDGFTYSNSCVAEAAGVTSYIDVMGMETILNWDCEPAGGGCYDPSGEYYSIGDIWFYNECTYIECLDENQWSDLIEIENCEGGCTLSDGTFVPEGWEGFGTGNNWCNSCFCDNGFLSCTELDCGGECEVDLDNDGICDEIDNCIGTWIDDIETGNCDQFTSEGQDVCSSYSGCEWQFNWGGWTNYDSECVGTFEVDNSYCDELITECQSDIDEDGICEDDCEELAIIIEDCDCSFFNPNTYTVFYTAVDETSCTLIETCYCECINDVNQNGICDEEEDLEEGCWEEGEFYCIGCEYFVDECTYVECLDKNQWSEWIEVDDCNTCNEIPISCDGGSWQTEVSWNIVDSNGNIVAEGGAPYSGTICLEDDCFVINMEDSYGDGWNGNNLNVGPLSFTILSGSTGTDDFCTPLEIIEGCTNPLAGNYNPEANVNNGSCEYDCDYLITYDSYIDLNYDNTVSNYLCYDYVSNGTYTIESVENTLGYNCDCVFVGCTDPEALNYDENATIDDCSCNYENNCSSISMITGSFTAEVSWNIEDENGNIVLSGGSPYCGNYCFEDGCYTINMIDSYGDGWNGNILAIDEYEYTFTTGTSAVGPFGYNNDNCIIEGCTNSLADNYNEEANYDDGSCEYGCEYLLTYESYVALGYDNTVSNYMCYDYVSYYNYTVEYVEETFGYNCDCVIPGCTDEEATNYNEEAFINDCSCVYDNDCPSISFNTNDSSLGWSISNMAGETILEHTPSGYETGNYCENYCFEDGCYIINMSSTWGGGWYQTTLDIGNESFTLPTGSEGIAVFEYNTEMNCEIGCTDPEASNYNPDAMLDDGSCVLFGCTIVNACNYNPDATAFDGSCYYCYMDDCDTYPSDIYNCDGTCLNDEDNDGICTELDNCPLEYNPNQEDVNNNGIGDACDGGGISLEENDEFQWHIYPNPFTSYTTIHFTRIIDHRVSVKIIDISGKVIYNQDAIESGHKIQNIFSPGYYIIQLQSNDNIFRENLIMQ